MRHEHISAFAGSQVVHMAQHHTPQANVCQQVQYPACVLSCTSSAVRAADVDTQECFLVLCMLQSLACLTLAHLAQGGQAVHLRRRIARVRLPLLAARGCCSRKLSSSSPRVRHRNRQRYRYP